MSSDAENLQPSRMKKAQDISEYIPLTPQDFSTQVMRIRLKSAAKDYAMLFPFCKHSSVIGWRLKELLISSFNPSLPSVILQELTMIFKIVCKM